MIINCSKYDYFHRQSKRIGGNVSENKMRDVNVKSERLRQRKMIKLFLPLEDTNERRELKLS